MEKNNLNFHFNKTKNSRSSWEAVLIEKNIFEMIFLKKIGKYFKNQV